MKFLAATKATQGQRKNDFGWVAEDELVNFGTECDGEGVDGKCGCKRALIGIETNKATTTFKVVDLPMTVADLARKIVTALEKAGWLASMSEAKAEKWGLEMAQDLCIIAAGFPVGAVLEKRGARFYEREQTQVRARG